MSKNDQTHSISLTGVLAVESQRDSVDMVTQQQPFAFFDTHAPMYATPLSVRLHSRKIKYFWEGDIGELNLVDCHLANITPVSSTSGVDRLQMQQQTCQ
jgi:hypothetical protein